jgi:hypothetical protein
MLCDYVYIPFFKKHDIFLLGERRKTTRKMDGIDDGMGTKDKAISITFGLL